AKYKGKKKLDKIIESFRQKNKKYDCVVGVSGGRDSSYLLYYLVKKYNLKILAYSADNGFIPKEAKENMKKMTDILNIKLVIEKHDFLKKCVKNNIISWMRNPSAAMIPMICCGCRLGIFRGLFKFAKSQKIPLIIIGAGNPVESSRFKTRLFSTNLLGNMKFVRKSKILSFLLGYLYEIIKNPLYFLKIKNTIMFLKEYFYCFHSNKILDLFYPNQRPLRLYRYIEWNENLIMSTIKEELNWKKSNFSSSPWRFDCLISILKNYLLKKSIGFNEKDEILSNMIREKMISKEEALRRMNSENITPWNVIFDVFKKILE
ncbi:MAG: hypothetical protein ACFFAO_06110, partial [Candidatus Hermodarchaeota archaeon]